MYGYVQANPLYWVDPTGEIQLGSNTIRRLVAAATIALGLFGTPTINRNDGDKTNQVAGEKIQDTTNRKQDSSRKSQQTKSQPKNKPQTKTPSKAANKFPWKAVITKGPIIIGIVTEPGNMGCGAGEECGPNDPDFPKLPQPCP